MVRLTFVSFFSLLAISGCGLSTAAAPDANSFALTVDEVLTDETMVVRQFHGVASRPCRVTVACGEGGKDQSSIWIRRAGDDHRNRWTVIVAVSLDPDAGDKVRPGRLQSLVGVSSGNGTYAGGPTRRNVDFSSLEDHIEFNAESGTYPIGQKLRLGSLRGNPIELLVEPLP